MSLAIWDHKVLPATRHNPSHAGWYSIYLPRRDGRLSWPSWLDSAPTGSRTSDLSITSLHRTDIGNLLVLYCQLLMTVWLQNGNKVSERKSDSVSAARPAGKFNSNVTSLHAAVMTSNGARGHSEICVAPIGMYAYLEFITWTDSFHGDCGWVGIKSGCGR